WSKRWQRRTRREKGKHVHRSLTPRLKSQPNPHHAANAAPRARLRRSRFCTTPPRIPCFQRHQRLNYRGSIYPRTLVFFWDVFYPRTPSRNVLRSRPLDAPIRSAPPLIGLRFFIVGGGVKIGRASCRERVAVEVVAAIGM